MIEVVNLSKIRKFNWFKLGRDLGSFGVAFWAGAVACYGVWSSAVGVYESVPASP